MWKKDIPVAEASRNHLPIVAKRKQRSRKKLHTIDACSRSGSPLALAARSGRTLASSPLRARLCANARVRNVALGAGGGVARVAVALVRELLERARVCWWSACG